ncbi:MULTISPECIES: hypothetical protein [Elizabethkingia]|uniref:hypothetical protein n=1 Tax=Elizabethkingia TaxID=308865 RepID=UPI0021A60EE4|nr:hypothetical protein [Elizabethkingia sp. HX CGY]MCT3689526.1 hypothetical protein [Elizabethkingia anophelis]MCT3706385.1 hypothetical protein [Elizabethkingia anophelis]MCT3713404.1 hypothetical protein [Elizabethkingia anophelis]MCT3716822.1 hypothetical protein [Elizabethkingia anophelis]MCT3730419.1 hypothetical protein [Elizabethkingia anophelis]
MKNENLKNAIVKAVEEVLDSVNHAKYELQSKNISISETKEICFEIEFGEQMVASGGKIKFNIIASEKIDPEEIQKNLKRAASLI